MTTHYAIATAGLPSTGSLAGRVYRNRESAVRAASRARGTGTCTVARVYECDSRDLARTADVSVIRTGERVVAQ